MSRRAPVPSVRVPFVDAEELRQLLRRLVWCEAGSSWAAQALADAERADGALAEIVNEERRRYSARGPGRGRLLQ